MYAKSQSRKKKTRTNIFPGGIYGLFFISPLPPAASGVMSNSYFIHIICTSRCTFITSIPITIWYIVCTIERSKRSSLFCTVSYKLHAYIIRVRAYVYTYICWSVEVNILRRICVQSLTRIIKNKKKKKKLTIEIYYVYFQDIIDSKRKYVSFI